MKGASASCNAPRSLNTPTNMSTAGAEPLTADKADGKVYGGMDGGVGERVTPDTGLAGGRRAAGGVAGGGGCGAGVDRGSGVGAGVRGGRGVAAGVKWRAAER